jgi:hypothetical protein
VVLAIGRELHSHDVNFWSDLRELGPTPGMVQRANHLLRGPEHNGAAGVVGPSKKPLIAFRRRVCARGRASRGSSLRTRGSRRVTTSRSAGGGSGDDPDPEPSARTGAHGLDSHGIQCGSNQEKGLRRACKRLCRWDVALVLTLGLGVGNVLGVVSADIVNAWAPFIAVLLSSRRSRNPTRMRASAESQRMNGSATADPYLRARPIGRDRRFGS